MRNRIKIRRESEKCASSSFRNENVRVSDSDTPKRVPLDTLSEAIRPKEKSPQAVKADRDKEERFRKADIALFGCSFEERLRQIREQGLV